MVLPNKALTNADLEGLCTLAKIAGFIGVKMHDEVPRHGSPNVVESAILNLDSSEGPGTHWTAYFVWKSNVYYFDAFGMLPPPMEWVKYFGKYRTIYYNTTSLQPYNSIICGHLAFLFLWTMSEEYKNAQTAGA